MTSLDELAKTHLSNLDVPPGQGVERVMSNGRHRLRRRRTATLAAATAAVVAFGGVGFAALQTSRQTQDTLVQLDAPNQAASDPATPESTPQPLTDASITVSIDTDSLPPRDGSELPIVATPVLDGWTITATAVSVTDRFSDSGTTTQYKLRAGASEVALDVFSGQIDIDGAAVILDRDDKIVDAALTGSDKEGWTLRWNERPGTSTGTAVIMSGPDRTELVDVASDLLFVDLELVGADQPEFVEHQTNGSPIFQGTTSNQAWSIVRSVDESIIVEIGGQSPPVTSTVATLGDREIDAVTVSKDGVQITAVAVPGTARSVAIASRDREPIALPLEPLDRSDRQITVAPVPADRNAAVLIVTFVDGTEVNIGLPPAPQNGWTTSRKQTSL